MAERIIILIAVAFACGYGFKQKIGGFNRKYFDVALYAMVALLFSRLYYLVVILSDGNDEILTVGVLGQAAVYLFFMNANISFTSRELGQKIRQKISIFGALGALITGAMFMAAAVINGTVYAYIGEMIYILSMCSAFYVAANVIRFRKDIVACDAAWKFNICVCVLIVINACYELAVAAAPELGLYAIRWILAITSSVTIAVMLPLLRKGMSAWQQ